MITYLSKSIAHFFTQKKIIPEEEIDSYIYGFEIMLINSINWGIILLIMAISGDVFETLLYMISVILLRHHTGGYHASTCYKCSAISISLYLLVLLVLHILSSIFILMVSSILTIISLITIFKLAPIAHENNPVGENHLLKHKVYSRIFAMIIAALITIFLIAQCNTFALSLSLGIFQVSVFLLMEYKKNKEV